MLVSGLMISCEPREGAYHDKFVRLILVSDYSLAGIFLISIQIFLLKVTVDLVLQTVNLGGARTSNYFVAFHFS